MANPRLFTPRQTDGWLFVRNVLFNSIYENGTVDPFVLENDIQRVWGYTVNERWVDGLTATSMASVLQYGVDPTTEETQEFAIEHVNGDEVVEFSHTTLRPVGVWASSSQYRYPDATPYEDKRWLGSDLTIRVNARCGVRPGEYVEKAYDTEVGIDAVGQQITQHVVDILRSEFDFKTVDILFSGLPGVYTIIVGDLHTKHLDTHNREQVTDVLLSGVPSPTTVDANAYTLLHETAGNGCESTSEGEWITTLAGGENWIRAPQTPHSTTGLLASFVSTLEEFDPFVDAVPSYTNLPKLPDTIPITYSDEATEDTLSVGEYNSPIIPGEQNRAVPIQTAVYAISLGVADPLVTNASPEFTE